MQSLQSLIKLHQHAIEEQRTHKTYLEEQKEKLLHYQNIISDEMKKESAIAAKDPMLASISYQQFIETQEERQHVIIKSLQDIEQQTEAITEKIAEYFGEIKTYELLQKKHDAQQKYQQAQSELKENDEFATNRVLHVSDDVI